ncbi:MAG: serine/threonine-protein kinase [Myxococcota bacterium]
MEESTGRRFGRYILKRRLAKGGMAEVFLADYQATRGLKKPVVLKKILPAFADDERFVQMFIDEARISVELSHGNIAQVFDFGEIDGEYFLAMELVRGHSLSEVRKRAAEKGLIIPHHLACYTLMETCKGLHYAHRKKDGDRHLGIVHRDVSPQNVMVSYEGQVKVVDFGIARAANLASKTRAGALKGKYLYFSPEQARGRSLDARSDVFAAGVVLYELVTGVLPFRGPLIEVLRSIVECRFIPPAQLVPTIKPSLEKIILKAMSGNPEDRYQSAAALQEALAGFIHSVAPRLTSAGLSNYMRYLYQEELAEQGMSVDLPSDFYEHLPLWRVDGAGGSLDPTDAKTDPDLLGSQADTSPEATRKERSPGRGRRAQRPVDMVRRGMLKRAAIAAGLLASMAVAIAAAIVSVRETRTPPPSGIGLVVVNSTPSGATVTVDGGEEEETTPFVLEQLDPKRFYELRFRLEGYQELVYGVSPSRDGPTNVSVELVRIPEPISRPSLEEVEAEIRRERGARDDEDAAKRRRPAPGGHILSQLDATLENLMHQGFGNPAAARPSPIRVEVPQRRTSIDVRRLPALRIPLRPRRRYELHLEGSAFHGNPLQTLPSSYACYVLARARGGGEYGIVQAGEPLEIARGVQAVFLLVPDRDPSDNEGSLLVRLVDGSGRKIERELDFEAHAFDPSARGATLIQEMNPVAVYEASIDPERPGHPLLFVRTGLPSALSGGGPDTAAFGILEGGRRFEAATELAVFSLRAWRAPPARTIEVVLTP